MSKVLSIYNDWAFREIVLPSRANTEYTFLLDAELFKIKNNTLVELECVNGKWIFRNKKDGISIRMKGQGNGSDDVLFTNARFAIKTPDGDELTVISEDRNSPLCVYKKYPLTPGNDISMGVSSDNTIRYRYPSDTSASSFVSRHHFVIKTDGNGAVLCDNGSANGTYINNVRVNGSKSLCYGDSIRVFGLNIIYLGNVLAINAPECFETNLVPAESGKLSEFADDADKNGSSKKQMFFRAPRTFPALNTEEIFIDAMPPKTDENSFSRLSDIGPALTMSLPLCISACMMGAGYGLTGSNGWLNPLTITGMSAAALSCLTGTFMAVNSVMSNRKKCRKAEEFRVAKYEKYLCEKTEYISEIYNRNAEALRQRYEGAEIIAAYGADSEKMWNRNFRHGDVMCYRLGLGSLPFPAPINTPDSSFEMLDDGLASKPMEIKKQFSVMNNVPICIDLKEKSIAGVIGDNNSWEQIVKNLLVQIAGNNSYTDVKIALVYDSDRISNAKSFEFVKWLPHTWSEDKSVRYYAAGKAEAAEVFYSLGQIIRARNEEKCSETKPHYILFVLNKELLEGELIAKYIGADSAKFGLTAVVAADKYESLPNFCEYIIENNSDFKGMYSTADRKADKIEIEFDKVGDDSLLSFAKRLANIEVDEREHGKEVPSAVSFFEMYGVSSPEQFNSAERWRKAKTSDSMKALIGFKSGKTPCYLDIHERYHGPHGLIAGTTGSGKSELLQTYIMSLAVNYSPDDVGFFLIDYKGGGMANLFEGLPHVIGAISNLSGNSVKRAMVSIKSENKRRQRIFSEYGVNSIGAYTSLYKNGDAKDPMPHMFIIIDEFAELKREEPEFMKELVSVAQVGRSLGVHLILATQKPDGNVDENIRSNAHFRLCLRVQSKKDSADVLEKLDAAYLTQAGRAYLQVGNDEIYELFQSGYSGAVYDEYAGDEKLVVAHMLDTVGKVDLVGNHLKIKHQEEIRKKWVTVLYNALLSTAGDDFGSRKLDDELVYDSAFKKELYGNINGHGFDYKPSVYNDARLVEFVKLVETLDDYNGSDFVKFIIDTASERGIKLPELRSKTQLEALKEYLFSTAVENGYNRKITLWMPPLPQELVLSDIEGFKEQTFFGNAVEITKSRFNLSAVVGKGDDPENQNQMPVYVDFAEGGHHAVCGMASSGKSTFLQTAVFSLINKYSSDRLNLYMLDFSSGLLNVFSDSKHAGAVMTDSEEDAEKISKFFTMMWEITEQRKKQLASSSFRDYVENGDGNLPAIVIVIDNYAAFAEKTEDRYAEMIKKLSGEGIRYGIYLLVSCGGIGRGELPVRIADNFRTVISLEMAENYQYADVMRCPSVSVYPESNVKGRGLVYYGDKVIEFQTALAVKGIGENDRNTALKEAIEAVNKADFGKYAKRIPVIPDNPVWEEYSSTEEYRTLLSEKHLVPNGYNAESAAYSALDTTSLLTYVVSGTAKSGKSTYMKNLIKAFADKDSEICIIEIGSDEFAHIADETGCRYITDGKGIYDYAQNVLLEEVAKRKDKKAECLNKHLENKEIFREMSQYKTHCIFIPNVREFACELYNRDSEAYNALKVFESLTGEKGRYYNFLFFAEAGDSDINDCLGFKLVQNFKENGKGIRFGGRYLSQRMFTYANIPYKKQGVSEKPGIGTVPSDDENVKAEQIVVPKYKR